MQGQRAFAAKVAVVWHWAANRTLPLAMDFEVTFTLTLTGPKIGWVKVPVATPAPARGIVAIVTSTTTAPGCPGTGRAACAA